MQRIFIFATALMISLSSTALAQFVPTLGENTPRACPQQPQEPDWIANIDIREAHKGNLVQLMYRAQGLEAVATSNDCSCETRFPSWEAAQQYYYEHYAGLERWEVLEKLDEYRRAANAHRKIAQPMCEQQGNW